MQRLFAGRGAIDLGLQRVHGVLRELGHPERALDDRVIHVAGTNGKGSVCAYIAAALREEGYRVGVFTSPHLVRTAVDAQLCFAPHLVWAKLSTAMFPRCTSRSASPLTGDHSTRLTSARSYMRFSVHSRNR